MALQPRRNPVKQAIIDGKTVFGLYVAVPSPMIVELAASAGFDFVRIDLSHAAVDLPTIVNMIGMAEACGIAPMVRVDNDRQKIQAVLEAGALGLVVPDVSTVDAARSVVRAVRFPPIGDRAMFSAARSSRYGTVSAAEYTQWSNEEILLGIQIESRQAVDRVDDIIAVAGIDMVLSGRGDLANSLGVAGQKNHPSVLAAEEKIFEAARSRGISMSVNLDPTAPNFPKTVSLWKSKGAQIITLGHDINIFRKSLETSLSVARQG